MPPPPAPNSPLLAVRTPLPDSPALNSPTVPNPDLNLSPHLFANPIPTITNKKYPLPLPLPLTHRTNPLDPCPLYGNSIHVIYDIEYAPPSEQQDLILPLQDLAGPDHTVTPWVLQPDNALLLAHKIPKDGIVVLHADASDIPAGGQFTALRNLLREAHFPRIMGHMPEYCERTLHKSVMNDQFSHARVPHVDTITITSSSDLSSHLVTSFIEGLLSQTKTQLFLKVDGGSNSCGLYNSNVISNVNDIYPVASNMLKQYGPIVIQRYLAGREFTVAVCTTKEGTRVFHPIERVFAAGQLFSPPDGTVSESVVDSNKEPQLVQECQRLTRLAYEAVGGMAWGRVDLRCDSEGKLYVLEVNNTASFAPNSYFALSIQACGVNRHQLLGMVARSGWHSYTEDDRLW